MKDLHKGEHLFFCGIGGSGMSALAQLCVDHGYEVSGSDRRFDGSETKYSPVIFSKLKDLGITLYPQDGSGVDDILDAVVVSTAIEDTVPDIVQAKQKNIPLIHRAALLARLIGEAELSIAVSGTSGKSTVTGMAGWLFHEAGVKPTIVNGAKMKNFRYESRPGNIVCGGDDIFVAEVDESDGSVVRFSPDIGLINNISLDHKPLADLRPLFTTFITNVKQHVIGNADDDETITVLETFDKNEQTRAQITKFSAQDRPARFQAHNIKTHGIDNAAFDFVDTAADQIYPVILNIGGRHNVYNALAALSIASLAGLDIEKCITALSRYEGLCRRFDEIGKKNDIRVIDDFAHNPDKIKSSLETVQQDSDRVIVVFQPHGFGPTRLMKAELIDVFARYLRNDDLLLMPPIYYAGGTASKDISSTEIIQAVTAAGKSARSFPTREDIPPYIAGQATGICTVIVMGARDDTLSHFARDILDALS